VTEVAVENPFIKFPGMLMDQEDSTELTPTTGSMLKLTSKREVIDLPLLFCNFLKAQMLSLFKLLMLIAPGDTLTV
jgi:hypothetical protein